MGRGKPSKADFEKSREKELSQKNRELQREIRSLKNEIERLKKIGEKPRTQEHKRHEIEPSLDICPECTKGSLSLISYYKINKRIVYKECSLCGHKTKPIETED